VRWHPLVFFLGISVHASHSGFYPDASKATLAWKTVNALEDARELVICARPPHECIVMSRYTLSCISHNKKAAAEENGSLTQAQSLCASQWT
jgi:hypothetical protein